MFGDKWQKGVTRWVIIGVVACVVIGLGIGILVGVLA